uniref:Uncharacterized protein n=1 Tax=Arundo donax TaxID=35708 RepID=A0A0A9BZ44_ARUDO
MPRNAANVLYHLSANVINIDTVGSLLLFFLFWLLAIFFH